MFGFDYLHKKYTEFYSKEPPTIESQAESIEKLCDTEYLYFWDIYLGYPPELRTFIKDGDLLGYKKLNFSYKGKNYANHVLLRCRSVLNSD